MRANAKPPHETLGTIYKGMTVAASDGWRGAVTYINGDQIVCLRAGQKPNDYLVGYRVFDRWQFSVSGDKAMVDLSASKRTTISRERHDAVVVDLARARIAQQWDSAPA